MVNWINIILLGISFIAFAIAGGFATDAARRVATIPGYSSTPKLKDSHRFLTIGAILTWITITLLVVGAILIAVGGAFGGDEALAGEEVAAEAESEVVESKSSFSIINIITYVLLFIILSGVFTVGILSAMAANDIRTASGVSDNKGSYRQSVIAAVISLIVFVFILVVLILILTYKPKMKMNNDIFSQLKDENFQQAFKYYTNKWN